MNPVAKNGTFTCIMSILANELPFKKQETIKAQTKRISSDAVTTLTITGVTNAFAKDKRG